MSDSPLHDDHLDPAADTGRFQAFADGLPEEPPRKVGVPFRVLTLLGGLLVLGLLVWLLFLL